MRRKGSWLALAHCTLGTERIRASDCALRDHENEFVEFFLIPEVWLGDRPQEVGPSFLLVACLTIFPAAASVHVRPDVTGENRIYEE